MPSSPYPPILPLTAPAPLCVPHPITALRYRIYTRPVDLAPLVIRQNRRFAWGAAHVSASVLGASHALTIELRDGRTVTELLTCLPPRDLPDAAAGSEAEWRLPSSVGEAWQTTFAHGALCGAVTLSRFELTRGSDRLSGVFENTDTLHEPFPTATGETAWTRVGWRRDGHLLHLETIHTYPEEGAGIRSATCFSLTDLTLADSQTL